MSTEAGLLDKDYLQARSLSTPSVRAERPPQSPCPRCSELGHWAHHCQNNQKPTSVRSSNTHSTPYIQVEQPRDGKKHRNSTPRSSNAILRFQHTVKCYDCSKKGHLVSNCPQKVLFRSLLLTPIHSSKIVSVTRVP